MTNDSNNSTQEKPTQMKTSAQKKGSQPAETLHQSSNPNEAQTEGTPETPFNNHTLHVIEELDGPLFIIWGEIEEKLLEEALKFAE